MQLVAFGVTKKGGRERYVVSMLIFFEFYLYLFGG